MDRGEQSRSRFEHEPPLLAHAYCATVHAQNLELARNVLKMADQSLRQRVLDAVNVLEDAVNVLEGNTSNSGSHWPNMANTSLVM